MSTKYLVHCFDLSMTNDQRTYRKNPYSSWRFTMKRWFSIFLQLFLLLAVSSCGVGTKSSRLPDQNELKALLIHLVNVEKRAPGMVIGMIADDPQERWVVGYGKLGATDERVPDGDTVFEIGSITKGFTGILLAQAVEAGEVKLDDPISLYLPKGVAAPEYEGKSITLLDLATHYSGLPPFITTNLCEEYTVDEMYAFLSEYRLTRPPGSIPEYSNLAFGLLGDLLARVAGQANYEALLLERIARPLGMDTTRIQLTPEIQPRLAAPHDDDLLPSCSNIESALYAAGGIRSTANDMLTFLAASMGMTETELQPAMQLATTPQHPSYAAGYLGLGWDLIPTSTGMIHFHSGRTYGYYSYLAWNPQRKVGVVVLTNAQNSIDDIGTQLLNGITSGRPIPRSIENILITWVILTIACLVFLVWELWRRRSAPYGVRLMWLLTTAFLGPLGLVIYWISAGGSRRSGGSTRQVSPVRRAFGSAAWATSGNALGGIGVLAQTFYLPAVSSNLIMQIAMVLLVPLFTGWLIFSVSRWISRSAAGHDSYNRRPLFAELVSTCLVLAGLFPTVNILSMRFFQWTFPSGYDLFYAPLWGALCLGAIVGTLVAYPFHLWMLRRGEFRWGTEAISEEVPVRGLTWYVKVALVVLSLVIMLGAIFVAMQMA
jgi:D-alanyl-D-alanine-carboxypeptidase/D-alanyl-D-alanine-endopeptidase